MWLRFSIILFVFYMTNCYCGIIHSLRRLKLEQDNGKTRERRAEDGLSYSGCRSEVSEDVPENLLLHDPNAAAESIQSVPTIKEKRCPREHTIVGSRHNTNFDAIVGANEPLDVRRRDLQVEVGKRICTGCLNRCSRFHTSCSHCSSFCTPEEMAAITEAPIEPSTSTSEAVVGSAIETNKVEKEDDDRAPLKNRFGDTGVNKMKRIYAVAALKSGLLKEVICKLLGIPNTSDIDTVVVWITTKSNKPPQISQGYNKQVSPIAERLTEQLNKELADKLQKKVQQGGEFLTNQEIEEAIGRIFNDPQNDPRHTVKSHGTQRTSGINIEDEDEVLPPYPIDANSIDLNMPQILNPGLIEDTPYINLGEQPPRNIVGVPAGTRIGQMEVENSSQSDQESSEDQEDSDGKMDAATPEAKELETKNIMAAEKSTDIKKIMGKPENENTEFDDEKKTEPDNTDENDTLGTSKRKKNKNKGQMPVAHQYYPSHYRANTETDGGITGMSPNIDEREGEPQQAFPSSPSRQEPSEFVQKLSNDMNHAPEPISANQDRKMVRFENIGMKQTEDRSEAPFNKNSHSDNIEAIDDETITGMSSNIDEREGMDAATLEAKELGTKNIMSAEKSTDIKKLMGKPENENIEFDNEKKIETDADENDTLGTSRRKKKKNKDKTPAGYQYYPSHYRANAETDDGITGMSPNIEESEGEPQQPFPSSPSRQEPSEFVQKLSKDINHAPQPVSANQDRKMIRFENIGMKQTEERSEAPFNKNSHSDNIEAIDNDTITGMSPNVEEREGEPQQPFASPPPRQEPSEFVQILSNDMNHAPKPISANQDRKMIRFEDTGMKQTAERLEVPFNRNSHSDNMEALVSRLRAPPNSNIASPDSVDVIGSPEAAEVSPVLEARAHGLNEKNRQSNVLEMEIQQAEGIKSSDEEGVIVSPIQSKEEEDIGSSSSSTEVEESSAKFQVNDPESLRDADLSDRRHQQLSNAKAQLPPFQTSTPIRNLDNFDKAAAALKDVKRLVQTIQEATKIDSQNRLLGKEEPTVGMEQKEQNRLEFPINDRAIETGRLDIPQQKASTTSLGSPPQLTAETVVESENVPQHVIENIDETAHAEMGDDQQINETPHSNTFDDRVGSQLLENVLWDRDRQHPIFETSRQKEENSNLKETMLGSPQLTDEENSSQEDKSSGEDINTPESNKQNIDINDQSVHGTAQNIPEMDNRGEFSKETSTLRQPPWSNALGKFIASDQPIDKNSDLTQPKDIYFIGNGIKLPLQVVRKNDGAVHLSVNLDKLCSCKNFTCPKNHTAIEETVGAILEKEAELKDQLAATNLDETQLGGKQEEINLQGLEDAPLGISGPGIDEEIDIPNSNSDTEESMSTHRNEREIANSKWLEMKDSIAGQYVRRGNLFKRSVKQEELNADPKLKIAHDKILSLLENSIINNTTTTSNKNEETKIDQQVTTTTAKSDILEQKSSASRKPVNSSKPNASNQFSTHVPAITFDDATPNYIKQLINKKLIEVRSRMPDMEKINELRNKQMLLSQEKLKNLFNTIDSQTVFDSPDAKDTKIGTDSIEDKAWEYILKQTPIHEKIQSLNDDVNNNILISPNALTYNSVMKNMLEKKDKGDETFDEVTPIKNSHQLKTLEEFESKLEELNNYVNQYSRDGEKMIKKEASKLLKMHSDDVIKQEVEIVNNIITWLKNLTVDKK